MTWIQLRSSSFVPVAARGLYNYCGTCDCMVAASRFPQHCNLLYTLDIPSLKLKDSRYLHYDPSGRFSDIMSLDQ